jgi:hypothetical protein
MTGKAPDRGTGWTIRIAFWMIARRAQDRAHSLKTRLDPAESSSPETKHCSAFAGSAVSRKDNWYRLLISSAKIRQKSLATAYGVG